MSTSMISNTKLQDDMNSIPLADDDPQVIIPEDDVPDNDTHISDPFGRGHSMDSIPSTFTNGSCSPSNVSRVDHSSSDTTYFGLPKDVNECRKKAWDRLFSKYNDELVDDYEIDLFNSDIELTEADDDINEHSEDDSQMEEEENHYFVKNRTPIRKVSALVQHWVDTGNPPFQLNLENDKTDTLAIVERAKKSDDCGNNSKHSSANCDNKNQTMNIRHRNMKIMDEISKNSSCFGTKLKVYNKLDNNSQKGCDKSEKIMFQSTMKIIDILPALEQLDKTMSENQNGKEDSSDIISNKQEDLIKLCMKRTLVIHLERISDQILNKKSNDLSNKNNMIDQNKDVDVNKSPFDSAEIASIITWSDESSTIRNLPKIVPVSQECDQSTIVISECVQSALVQQGHASDNDLLRTEFISTDSRNEMIGIPGKLIKTDQTVSCNASNKRIGVMYADDFNDEDSDVFVGKINRISSMPTRFTLLSSSFNERKSPDKSQVNNVVINNSQILNQSQSNEKSEQCLKHSSRLNITFSSDEEDDFTKMILKKKTGKSSSNEGISLKDSQNKQVLISLERTVKRPWLTSSSDEEEIVELPPPYPRRKSLDPDVSPDEQEEKARLIAQVLELQNTLDDLSQRVDSVKEENLKLRSENQVLGQYIENLMSASSVFQSTSPKTKKK